MTFVVSFYGTKQANSLCQGVHSSRWLRPGNSRRFNRKSLEERLHPKKFCGTAGIGAMYNRYSIHKKKHREQKNSCTDCVSSITFDMTWNSKKKSFNCLGSERKGEEERKLSDIKSSHNGSSKEIKSINNLHKKRTVTQRKLPAIKIYFQGEWKERRFFAQLNIIRFFGAPDLFSFVLRKRISFQDSLKRGIKKIKYLSFVFAKNKSIGEAAAETYNISL